MKLIFPILYLQTGYFYSLAAHVSSLPRRVSEIVTMDITDNLVVEIKRQQNLGCPAKWRAAALRLSSVPVTSTDLRRTENIS